MTEEILVEDLELPAGSILNPNLVNAQGLDLNAVQRLVWLHYQKDEIMRNAHEAVRGIENEMQRVWGFEVDSTKHTHRHMIPYPQKLFIPENPDD